MLSSKTKSMTVSLVILGVKFDIAPACKCSTKCRGPHGRVQPPGNARRIRKKSQMLITKRVSKPTEVMSQVLERAGRLPQLKGLLRVTLINEICHFRAASVR
jgi:hypothetical protein